VSFFYQNPLVLVAILTILLSPFILKLASKQDQKAKQNLKYIFIAILSCQILLGFLNWVPVIGWVNGFSLAIIYPVSFLWAFFAISLLQIILIVINVQKLNILIVTLNFINSVLIFVSLNLTSRILGFQIFSIPAVFCVFLVLFGNIVGLALINKDKNLLKKYSR